MDVTYPGCSGKLHRQRELLLEVLDHITYATPAVERETVEGGTTNSNRGSTGSERFEDVHAKADASIEEYWYPPLNYLGDLGGGPRLHRERCPVGDRRGWRRR